MPSEIHLPASCTIVNINTMYGKLAADISNPADSVLHAADVTSVDTAALQTLVAFIQHRHETGLSTRFESYSPAFIEAAKELGLSSALGIC